MSGLREVPIGWELSSHVSCFQKETETGNDDGNVDLYFIMQQDLNVFRTRTFYSRNNVHGTRNVTLFHVSSCQGWEKREKKVG